MDLTQVELLKKLSPSVITSIKRHIKFRSYARKELIFGEGKPSDSVFFILKGRVKVFLEDDSGKEIVMNFHEEGEFFGELGVIERIPRTAAVSAMEDCDIAVLQAADFNALRQEHSEFNDALMHSLVERLRNATETIRRLGLMDVYGRIAVTFLNLAENWNGRLIIREKLTQQSIANRVGASREMVARILKDLRVGDYISMEDGLIIINKSLPHSW